MLLQKTFQFRSPQEKVELSHVPPVVIEMLRRYLNNNLQLHDSISEGCKQVRHVFRSEVKAFLCVLACQSLTHDSVTNLFANSPQPLRYGMSEKQVNEIYTGLGPRRTKVGSVGITSLSKSAGLPDQALESLITLFNTVHRDSCLSLEVY